MSPALWLCLYATLLLVAFAAYACQCRQRDEERYSEGSLSAFVLRAHVCDVALKRTWARMREDLGVDRVFLAFDESGGRLADCDPGFYEANRSVILVHTNDECLHEVPAGMHVSMWVSWSCTVVKASRMVLDALPSVVYMWIVESDVYCNGSYRAAFARTHHLDHDFLATDVEHRGEKGNNGWMWWNNLQGNLANTPLDRQVKSFFPVTRYSRALLDAVATEYGRSSGFCEVYFPTLARSRGLTYASLPRDMGVIQMGRANELVPSFRDDKLYHKYLF
jgi:hypothetical protein